MKQEISLLRAEQDYLWGVAPHRTWYYIVMFIAILLSIACLWVDYAQWTSNFVHIMAVPVLILYWLLQFQIMRSAVYVAQHDWHENIPESQIGTVSRRSVIFAKVYAVLRHHRFFIIVMTLILLALSLEIASFLLFQNTNQFILTDILQYIGVVRTGYVPASLYFPFSLSSRVFFAVIMGLGLLILTIGNSLLSVSIGLWVGQLRRSIIVRFVLVALVVVVFLSLYSLRGTPNWTCQTPMGSPYHSPCPEIYMGMLIMDSFQAIALSFIDGGASLMTGIHSCGGHFFNWGGSQGRHLLAGIVTFVFQLGLSFSFLHQSNIGLRKKKFS